MSSISRKKSFKRSLPATCSRSSSLATQEQRTETPPTLAPVTLAEQWSEITGRLPADWGSARLTLTVAEDERADHAALMLSPLTPGRTGSTFRLAVRRGADPGRVFSRLDAEGIRGRLDLAQAEAEAEAQAIRRERAEPFVEQWDRLAAGLPTDWSDVYAEVELDSSDYLQRGALLLAPVNPAHYGGPTTLRFRTARVSGYGTAAGMTRRCLERLDEEAITGEVRILRALSATQHAATQGPVWRVGGRSV
jgi:hypothetical protein